MLLHVELNQVHPYIFIVLVFISAHSDLDIICGRVRKIFAEPWQTRMLTALLLLLSTSLSIPEWIVYIYLVVKISTSLTEIVVSNKLRCLRATVSSTRALRWIIMFPFDPVGSKRPDVFSWMFSMRHTNPIHIGVINSAVITVEPMESIVTSNLVSSHPTTHALVLDVVSRKEN